MSIIPKEEYLRWNPDGTQEHVVVTRTMRDLSGEILKGISTRICRRTANVFKTSDGQGVTIYATDKEVYAAKFLTNLVLRTHYEADSAGVYRPVFLSPNETDSEKSKYVEFSGMWKVPISMRLMFAARIKGANTAKPYTYPDQGCYMFAWDAEGRAFTLPLPNTFEPGNMCMGAFDGGGYSIQEAFQKACDQLEKSSWNSDLINTDKNEKCNALFQFGMDENTAYSLPVLSDWMGMCKKVGTAVTEILNPN